MSKLKNLRYQKGIHKEHFSEWMRINNPKFYDIRDWIFGVLALVLFSCLFIIWFYDWWWKLLFSDLLITAFLFQIYEKAETRYFIEYLKNIKSE